LRPIGGTHAEDLPCRHPKTARELELPLADLDLPDGFAPPDWTAPFDLEAHLRQVPADATVKGMFLSSTVEAVQSRGGGLLTGEKFTAFRDYPMGRTLELLAEGAPLVYPDHPLRDGMRRLARPAFPVFAGSLVGRAVFAATGSDPRSVLGLASRAWRHATNTGKLESEPLDETSMRIHISDFHLTEMVAVGIAEGVLEACGRRGVVAPRMQSASEGDVIIRWA